MIEKQLVIKSSSKTLTIGQSDDALANIRLERVGYVTLDIHLDSEDVSALYGAFGELLDRGEIS